MNDFLVPFKYVLLCSISTAVEGDFASAPEVLSALARLRRLVQVLDFREGQARRAREKRDVFTKPLSAR